MASDPDDYFTPEIREILAQRAMGYADADPTPPDPPGCPNRDTAASYEAARREREDLRDWLVARKARDEEPEGGS